MTADGAAKEPPRGRRRIWRRLLLGAAGAVAAGGSALLAPWPASRARRGGRWEEAQWRQLSALPPAPAGRRLAASAEGLIHVCLASDDTDLRGLVVTIRSAVASAREPQRLHFHVVTSGTLAKLYKEAFKNHLPGVRVSVRHNRVLTGRIQSLLTFRSTSRARRELFTPLNFAPFYMQRFLAAKGAREAPMRRVIYLDPDAVVLGDLAELQAADLQGHPVAAVRHCGRRLDDVLDLEVLGAFGLTGLDPNTCITQRAVFVCDLATWEQRNMTGKIEDWLLRYRASANDLWFDGASLAPWVLALGEDFAPLGEEWMCRGAASDSMTIPESQALRSSGFDPEAFRTLGATFSEYGRVQPYIATCAASAKLLHFDGGVRPWMVDRLKRLAPVCQAPQLLMQEEWAWLRRIKVYCEEVTFVSCAEIWWKHISEDAACDLKDFEKEWRDEEDKWLDRQLDDEEGKRAAEREARQQLAAEDQARLSREELQLRERRRLRFRQLWGSEEPLPSKKRRERRQDRGGPKPT